MAGQNQQNEEEYPLNAFALDNDLFYHILCESLLTVTWLGRLLYEENVEKIE